MMMVVPLILMVVVLLDAHIHPQAAEETSKTSVGEAKTQRRI